MWMIYKCISHNTIQDIFDVLTPQNKASKKKCVPEPYRHHAYNEDTLKSNFRRKCKSLRVFTVF